MSQQRPPRPPPPGHPPQPPRAQQPPPPPPPPPLQPQIGRLYGAQAVPQQPIPGGQPLPPPPALLQLTPVQYASPGTVALPYFKRQISSSFIVKHSVTTREIFRRAVKVFLMSYPEMTDTSPQVYKDQLEKYLRTLRSLYLIPTLDIDFLEELETTIREERYQIHVNVKRFRGRDRLINGQLFLMVGGVNQPNKSVLKADLDSKNELQPYKPIKMGLPFDLLALFRRDVNHGFDLTVDGDWSPILTDPVQNHFISLAETHPEGFESWFDFGRGVELLISIEYKVPIELNITPEEVSVFHYETIKHVLYFRLKYFNNPINMAQYGHREGAHRLMVSYDRPLTPQNSAEMFWTPPDRRQLRTVKFVDFQIPINTNEGFEENVCLCSEWCNWNAFFHYNPVYRFILVRHHQLFLSNPTNIPDMYQALTIFWASSNRIDIKPVLRLMSNANDYRKIFYENYTLRNRSFRRLKQSAEPKSDEMLAVAYNKLRNHINAVEISQQLNDNPFDDNCIEGLLCYLKTLLDLHYFHGKNRAMVVDTKQWAHEKDDIERHQFPQFISESLGKALTIVKASYDYLFSTDYEYTDQVIRTDEEMKVKGIRDNLLKKSTTGSPFNVRFILNDFISLIQSLHKLLARSKSQLPAINRPHTTRNMFLCFSYTDTQMKDIFLTNRRLLRFYLDPKSTAFPSLKQVFFVFYTLKCYSFLFVLQKHFITIAIDYEMYFPTDHRYTCYVFDFIWENKTIEANYEINFGQNLFEISGDIENTFREFYENFWGKADHEVDHSLNYLEVIHSGYQQYARLYYWVRNGGNDRRKFKKIIETFVYSLNDLFDKSYAIFKDRIIPAIAVLSHSSEYYIEVFDHLVYYLVRANCAVILCTVAKLLKHMNDLQDSKLLTNHRQLSLTKPDWVLLLKTYTDVLSAIDRVLINYIVFDDEFNRIAETYDQTKQLVKSIYRQFYSMLSSEWIGEIITILQIPCNHMLLEEFLHLHLTVGIPFMAAFIDDFRRIYRKRRIMIEVVFSRIRPNSFMCLTHHKMLAIETTIDNYFTRGRAAIQRADPFDITVWGNDPNFISVFDSLNRVDPQSLNIDLNAANI